MSTREQNLPETLEQPEVSPVVLDDDLENNFPEIDKVEETDGLLPVGINFDNFEARILEKHEADRFETAYDTRGNPRGLCLIINNKSFDGKLDDRTGTDVDRDNLSNLFNKLLYKVEIVNNQTAEEMKEACRSFILNPEHEQYTSCVLAVLSHGTNGKILGRDSKPVDEYKDILSLFNHSDCKLTGKPKFVIIQACRIELDRTDKDTQHPMVGQEVSDGPVVEGDENFDLVDHLQRLNYGDAQKMENRLPPDYADLLIAHSTLPGFISWRNTKQGSWFIQAIVQIFSRNFHSEHVADMMVQVNLLVSKAFRGENKKNKNQACQMPSPTNHLRKKFYFFPSK
ncbi:hypothetical protein BOX15_Mlig006913g1 [Macrostomum lignano]|uniref:Uncharacterized protein n=2 Tax=Macrostomum lignano TaxID=282301 RepID=A0A267DK40_9PLAT|nr:hypothetical protein BOX15_Mlig006913g2 [Macrostomum lignano]PAA90877.1 hypothetical protein BOX15_Mlig006913g1 [Macrostomum lignano]